MNTVSVTFDPDGNAVGLGDKTTSMPPTQAKRHVVRTYVAVDAVYAMLDAAYHPQGGENPTHPADTFQAWVDALSESEQS